MLHQSSLWRYSRKACLECQSRQLLLQGPRRGAEHFLGDYGRVIKAKSALSYHSKATRHKCRLFGKSNHKTRKGAAHENICISYA